VKKKNKQLYPFIIALDGRVIDIPNLELYVVNPKTLKIRTVEAILCHKYDLVFYYKKNAEKYVKDHKLKYSINDILNAIDKSMLIDDNVILISDLKLNLGINEN